MKKYRSTLIFYLVSFVVVYGLNVVSPGQQDGGLGFGSVAIILLVLSAIVLMIVNFIRSFKGGNDLSYHCWHSPAGVAGSGIHAVFVKDNCLAMKF